jgi:hypothetical protein
MTQLLSDEAKNVVKKFRQHGAAVTLDQGKVTAVDGELLTVEFGASGDKIPNVKHLTSYNPVVDDVVWALRFGADLFVIGPLGVFAELEPLQSLKAGSGLSGTDFDGSTERTWTVDTSVLRTTGDQEKSGLLHLTSSTWKSHIKIERSTSGVAVFTIGASGRWEIHFNDTLSIHGNAAGITIPGNLSAATMTAPSWTTPSLASGISHGIAGNAQHTLRPDGLVQLRGSVTGISSSPQTLFTLPSGRRPPEDSYFVVTVLQTVGSVYTAGISITTAGVVSVARHGGSATGVALTGISFYV